MKSMEKRICLNIPKILAQNGFTVREMTRTDLIRNALRNILSHPIDFFRAEAKTKVFIKALKGVYKVPPLDEKCIRMIYALRKKG